MGYSGLSTSCSLGLWQKLSRPKKAVFSTRLAPAERVLLNCQSLAAPKALMNEQEMGVYQMYFYDLMGLRENIGV